MGVLKKPVSYLQTDPRWANVDYSTTGETTNIKESGCGPTAAAMLAETLTGKTITPVDACRWSLKMGYKACKQGTYYAFFKPFFAQYGINCYQFNSSNLYGNSSSSVHDEVFSMVDKGWYFIACMGTGTWTSGGGHFVVLYGYDKATNKVYINDPASVKEARTEGNLKTFRSQVKYYFAADGSEYNKEVIVPVPANTAYKKIAKIPLKDISKMEIYVNSKKKSLATIKKETGADYVINGGLFNSNWTPCPLLKVEGTMLSKTPYSMYGYGWNKGSDIEMSLAHANYDNYIGCICLLNPVTGKSTVSDTGDTGGTRGRSAIGLSGNNLILYCTKDGSVSASKPSELQQEMLDLGCDTAVMLDGGRSSQSDFDGQKITSSRVVHNLILVYIAKNTTIKDIQAELNDRYGFGLAEDNSWGPKSKKAMIQAVQTEINNLYGGKLVVDGSWGSLSKAACPDIKSITKNNLAWLIQACLIVKGYDLELDGSYGPSTAYVVKQFQKVNGLAVDGICGRNTMTKLLG